MQIIELDKRKYQDYPVSIDYDTDSYYDLIFDDDCIRIQKKAMNHLHHHQGDVDSEKLFQDWVDKARAFGAFEDDKLIGVIEVGIDYSQRLFVNLLKVEKQYRRKGAATALINKAKELMYENNIRSLILEVQSCNVAAIEFYKAQGFKLIGFDTTCYSNHDLQNKEVRFDLGFINVNYKE